MSSHERSVRAEAIILRHNDWGEADRQLRLYTRELGKVSAIAKGVRKPRSRKAGHLEPFTRSSLQLARGRDFWIVTQAETLDAYLHLREDLMRLGYANYIVELLDRFTYEEGENQPLYRLLADSLKRLDGAANPALVVRYYEIRLLDLVGFRPQLFNCANCGNEIKPEDQYFSAAQGGVLCPNCGKGISGVRPVSLNALRYMRHFQRSSYSEASKAPLSPALDREMEMLLQHYITYVLERGLNTPAFLKRIKRDSAV